MNGKNRNCYVNEITLIYYSRGSPFLKYPLNSHSMREILWFPGLNGVGGVILVVIQGKVSVEEMGIAAKKFEPLFSLHFCDTDMLFGLLAWEFLNSDTKLTRVLLLTDHRMPRFWLRRKSLIGRLDWISHKSYWECHQNHQNTSRFLVSQLRCMKFLLH